MGGAEVENRDDKRIIEQLIKVVGILAKNSGDSVPCSQPAGLSFLLQYLCREKRS
jgi:hypothetical protein